MPVWHVLEVVNAHGTDIYWNFEWRVPLAGNLVKCSLSRNYPTDFTTYVEIAFLPGVVWFVRAQLGTSLDKRYKGKSWVSVIWCTNWRKMMSLDSLSPPKSTSQTISLFCEITGKLCIWRNMTCASKYIICRKTKDYRCKGEIGKSHFLRSFAASIIHSFHFAINFFLIWRYVKSSFLHQN